MFISYILDLNENRRSGIYLIKAPRKRCPECGTEYNQGQELCNKCGFPLFLITWIIKSRNKGSLSSEYKQLYHGVKENEQ